MEIDGRANAMFPYVSDFAGLNVNIQFSYKIGLSYSQVNSSCSMVKTQVLMLYTQGLSLF